MDAPPPPPGSLLIWCIVPQSPGLTMDPGHVMNFSGVFECGFEFIVTSKELGVHRTHTLRGMSTGWSAATIAWAPLFSTMLNS